MFPLVSSATGRDVQDDPRPGQEDEEEGCRIPQQPGAYVRMRDAKHRPCLVGASPLGFELWRGEGGARKRLSTALPFLKSATVPPVL